GGAAREAGPGRVGGRTALLGRRALRPRPAGRREQERARRNRSRKTARKAARQVKLRACNQNHTCKGNHYQRTVRPFARQRHGWLIAAGISIAIITAVQALGTSLNTTFTSVSTALK